MAQLVREAGLSPLEGAALAALATRVDALGRANAAEVDKKTGLGRTRSTRLIDAARLLVLPDMTPQLALAAGDAGLTFDALTTESFDALRNRLDRLPGVSVRRLAGWMSRARRTPGRAPASLPSAGRTARGSRPSAARARKVAVARTTTWPQLARDLYGRSGAPVAAARLAAANRAPLDAPVAAGTAVLVPSGLGKAALPADDAAAKSLRAFAPYLAAAEAGALARGGYYTPAQIAAAPRATSTDGLTAARFAKIQRHAQLASLPGMPPDVARYLAVDLGRSVQELARINPLDLLADLQQGQAVGLVDAALVLDMSWVMVLIDLLPLDEVLLIGEDSAVCERHLPPNTHLENYYTYRFAPGGRTAEALQAEIDAKTQWLADAEIYQVTGSVTAERTEGYVTRGLALAQVSVADLKEWHGPGQYDLDAEGTLGTLRMFVASNLDVLRLLAMLTEGHEAYRHREYGLALAAYERADAWFAAQRSDDYDNQRWWENGADGKPRQQAESEGVHADWQNRGFAGYYAGRRDAADAETLLDALEVRAHDYRRFPLYPLRLDDLGADQPLPFAKFLYYIRAFLLPMCKADCYARLGNYCLALEHYFLAHYEETFSNDGSTATEYAIRMVAGADDSLPGLTSVVIPPAPNRYYPPFLNPVEKRLVRLRVAELLLARADAQFRRRDTANASAAYAQVLRILQDDWSILRGNPAAEPADVAAAHKLNPRALRLLLDAQAGLTKIGRGLNFLGYPDDHVPTWTYHFLLGSARYFAERARQLGRDALQFLESAEREQGNRRLLQQAVAIGDGQVAVESRRVDEARAAVDAAQAAVDLAQQRAANGRSRRVEFEMFAPARQALGVVGGGISGAGSGASLGGGVGGLGGSAAGSVGAVVGMPIGLGVGAVTAYLSGAIELQAQRNELIRQQLELDAAVTMAGAELQRMRSGYEMAQMARQVAVLNSEFARSNLAYAQAKMLNAEFWFDTSLRLSDLAATELERAVGVAFLTEQAFEFMEGRRLDVIRFDYGQAEGALAADALLSDVDSIEHERIMARTAKSMPVRHVVRLREKDFLSFAAFKRTGTITFDVPLFEFDMAYPGSYQQRIAAVEVEVRGLVPPDGLRGTLRKGGVSALRYRQATAAPAPPNTAPDWLTSGPPGFRIAPVVQPAESLIVSSFDIRRDAAVLRPDPGEQLRMFEGSGVATTWTFSLDPHANELDFSTITDVNLILHFSTQFDEELRRAVLADRRKLLAQGVLPAGRSQGFSFREAFPDQLYHLHNPPTDASFDPRRRREVELTIPAGLFHPNQINRRLHTVVLAFAGPQGFMDLVASLGNGTVTFNPTDFLRDQDSEPVRAADGRNQAPEGTWRLTLTAADNTDLRRPGTYRVDPSGRVALDSSGQPIPDPAGVPIFDPDKLSRIDDVWLIFTYRYAEAGEGGEPVVAWSHFANASDASYVHANQVRTTPWTTVPIEGSASWAVESGVLRQRNMSKSLRIPQQPRTWTDSAVAARLDLPTASGATAGLILRYTPPPTSGSGPSYYAAKLVRLADGHVDALMEGYRFGTRTVLGLARAPVSAGATAVDMVFRVIRDKLELRVAGGPVLFGSDTSAADGTAGMYAGSAGVGFREILISDLSGR